MKLQIIRILLGARHEACSRDSDLVRDGYELEVWTTVAHEGRVYIPGRWADWDAGRIYPGVSTTILDPKQMKVVGTAEDARCASGGRVSFDEAGYAYVMGDGRTYSLQMFARAKGESAPENCLLRIAPGETKFDPDYFYSIPSISGGLDSITELDTARQGSGLGFAKRFYPDQLPKGVRASRLRVLGYASSQAVAHRARRSADGRGGPRRPVRGRRLRQHGDRRVAVHR
jgi:hypothetical protein